MHFENLFGNKQVKVELQSLLSSKKIPQAFLFSGPDGIGKKLFAQVFSSHLLNPENLSPLCLQKIEKGIHPDLRIFSPEGKGGIHPITSIRSLKEETQLPPFEAPVKVFVIQEADRMLPESANALLKTLEEPIYTSFIILLTSKETDLLPTIASRCRKISFSSATKEEIVSFLQKNHQKSESEAKQIATFAGGSFKKALEIATNEKFFQKKQLLLELFAHGQIDSKFFQKTAQIEALIEEESKENETSNYKEIEEILSYILMWYRDLHLLSHGIEQKFLFFPESPAFFPSAKNIPSLEKLHLWIEEIKDGLERNMKFRFCLENLFMKIFSEF